MWPDRSYSDLSSWEKGWVKAREWPKLERLYAERIGGQAEPLSSSNPALQSRDAQVEREEKLLDAALDPAMDTFQRYAAWRQADDFERGQQDVISDLYSLLLDERPDDVPQDEVERAFVDWLGINDEKDVMVKQQRYAAFNAAYPPASPVGRYVRSQTNTRRVPMRLLQQLGGYQRAQGAYDSGIVRTQMVFETVLEQTGDEWKAALAASEYHRWWFMLQETQEVAQERLAS